jgi:hypothetical protein
MTEMGGTMAAGVDPPEAGRPRAMTVAFATTSGHLPATIDGAGRQPTPLFDKSVNMDIQRLFCVKEQNALYGWKGQRWASGIPPPEADLGMIRNLGRDARRRV